MDKSENVKQNPRKVFWKCGTCSQAMFRLLNQEFGNTKPSEEKASDLLAGGIAQKGFQCGMLWGGALAVGTESFCRYKNKDEAIVAAVLASKYLIHSFQERTGAVNCREITKTNWEKKSELVVFMLKTIVQGFVFSPCFNLIAKWTPEAVQQAGLGLSEKMNVNQPCLSCATEVLKKMGASDEISVMVAGFAGGIGLSGNACGALSAVVWFKMLEWDRKNPTQRPAMLNNPEAKKIFNVFYRQTDSAILCRQISQRQFATIEEHTEYIQNGGCRKLLDALAAI